MWQHKMLSHRQEKSRDETFLQIWQLFRQRSMLCVHSINGRDENMHLIDRSILGKMLLISLSGEP